MIRWIRVVVALALALALSASVYWGYTLFLLATGLIVFGVAYGWPRLTDSPQPRATSIMLGLFGLAGLLAAFRDDTAPYLDWLPVLAGLGLLWTFVQNLTRGMGASDAVANVSAQVAGVVIVLSASTWVAAITVPGDKEAIVVGLVSLIVAGCMTALPWPAIYTSPLAIAMPVAVAGILSVLIFKDAISVPVSLVLGGIMGLLVAGVDRMLGLIAYTQYQAVSLELSQNIELKKNVEKARSFAVQLALGAAPIALGGVVVYSLERIAF
ncbi:ammonia permease [Brevibacterium aurantiacum]|uniref:ammonia permease n=1 Tax=Brevibacterium aurantiacum TaxID=273384 RepID=UPI0021B3C6FA|nr:ammonia permease [Brevibacterium aurantiacum]